MIIDVRAKYRSTTGCFDPHIRVQLMRTSRRYLINRSPLGLVILVAAAPAWRIPVDCEPF